MKYDIKTYGNINGKEIFLYTFTNTANIKICIINYGCIVTNLFVPDRNGNPDDIALGYDNLESYINDTSYLGAVVGRYANRIGGSVFIINGKKYKVSANEGQNCLHGGRKGFNKVIWDATICERDNAAGVEFIYLSRDNEEGFPGNLNVKVTYLLSEENEFIIEYSAGTDKETVINLTQHNYWNLAGENSGNILKHRLHLNADHFAPVNKELIPTGELLPVKNTPMDFLEQREIGSGNNADFYQLKIAGGYDHNWVLNKQRPDEFAYAASVFEQVSGRQMDIFTTEPGIQFYSGNSLNNIKGKKGRHYPSRSGLCLETQHFPDSPNKPEFPSTLLKPGEKFSSKTIYKFSVK